LTSELSLTFCAEQDKCPEGHSQDALVRGEGGAGTDEHWHTPTLHHLGMEAFCKWRGEVGGSEKEKGRGKQRKGGGQRKGGEGREGEGEREAEKRREKA